MRYSVKAAAMATGISEARLRTWERRYGIPRPPRSDTGRRLYSEQDLEVIRRMAALVARGVPASEAATVAATEELAHVQDAPRPDEHPSVSQIVKAAGSYDERSLVSAIHEGVNSLGTEAVIDSVLMPAMRRIGEAWGDQTLESANEHFATELIRRETCRLMSESPAPHGDAPLVLLACAEDERHDLGLLALALLLRTSGIRTVYLGADVPGTDIARASAVLKPDAVCVGAVLPGSVGSAARAIRALATGRLQPRLFAGGPALGGNNLEEGLPAVRLPQSIAQAAGMVKDSLLQG
jgi:DNA-binding transcriptional MerR regulator